LGVEKNKNILNLSNEMINEESISKGTSYNSKSNNKSKELTPGKKFPLLNQRKSLSQVDIRASVELEGNYQVKTY